MYEAVATYINMKNFLKDRTQVVHNGKKFNSIPVTSGVPRGSVLGVCGSLVLSNSVDIAYKIGLYI